MPVDPARASSAFGKRAGNPGFVRRPFGLIPGQRVSEYWRMHVMQERQSRQVNQKKVRNWIAAVGAQTSYIEPGSPWENGYCESFNARFRDELLDGEIFYSLQEAEILIEQWRIHYNTVRPHSALGYRPPAKGRMSQVFRTAH